MAHYQPGPLGEFRGGVGGIIVYRWRHLKIGRSSPTKKKRKKKGSESQQTQRSRLGVISRYLSKFTLVIRDGFPSKRMKMTSMNAAVKENYHTALVGEFPNIEVADALIQLSKGSLDHIYRPTLHISEDDIVTIKWTNPEHQKLNVDDEDVVHLVFYSNELRRRQMFYDTQAKRADGFIEMPVYVSFMKGQVHAWMFLVSVDGKRASNSRYLGAFSFNKK